MSNPLKFEPITVSTAAVGLNPPASGVNVYALIRVESNAIRWRDDGTNPTASVGSPLNAGDLLKYGGPFDGNLSTIKFIRSGAADAIINVHYYGS